MGFLGFQLDMSKLGNNDFIWLFLKDMSVTRVPKFYYLMDNYTNSINNTRLAFYWEDIFSTKDSWDSIKGKEFRKRFCMGIFNGDMHYMLDPSLNRIWLLEGKYGLLYWDSTFTGTNSDEMEPMDYLGLYWNPHNRFVDWLRFLLFNPTVIF